MIYVTQGHEHSIALEIFLKSFAQLDKRQREHFTLVVNRKVLTHHLNLLKMERIHKDLHCLFIEDKAPLSSFSLFLCLEQMKVDDILITLPTSKDQLIFNGRPARGHTELFRRRFDNDHLVMAFSNEDDLLVLMTDHIPLCEVSKSISTDLITKKTLLAIKAWEKYFYPIKEVFFAGINPHAGENGLLGDEDHAVHMAVKRLQKKKSCLFKGPFSGDSLSMKSGKGKMMVYMYHDQGLGWFKEKHRFSGMNITLGLPFLRFSVDHGTAFDLYGKGQACYSGCLKLLEEALKVQEKINGRKSHQCGEGPGT